MGSCFMSFVDVLYLEKEEERNSYIEELRSLANMFKLMEVLKNLPNTVNLTISHVQFMFRASICTGAPKVQNPLNKKDDNTKKNNG